MQFNYASEKRKFETEWKRLWEEYRKAGMNEEAIRSMYEYDWGEFKSRRVYCLHTQFLEGEETEQNIPGRLIDAISVQPEEMASSRRYGWIDEIESREMVLAIQKLTKEDREILTLWAIEQYSLTEIAKMQHVSQQAVSKRVIRLKKYLKKCCKKVVD